MAKFVRLGRPLLAIVLVASVLTTVVIATDDSPAGALPALSCNPNLVVGSDVSGNLLRLDPLTATTDIEFTTVQSPYMNGVASNSDKGTFYWGYGQNVYWYDSLTGLEGLLVDLSTGGAPAPINGNLESGGAAYLDGWYYFGAEDGSASSGLYRIQIDNSGRGTSVVPGSLELLHADQPEVGITATYPGVAPDYGDLVAYTNGLSEPIIEGSTAARGGTTGHLWTYNTVTGAFDIIIQYGTSTALQLGTNLSGVTYGAANSGGTASSELVDLATGARTNLGTYTTNIADMGGSFCVTADPDQLTLSKTVKSTVDTDGSGDLTPGDVVTFEFVVTNSGTLSLGNISLTDPLPGLSALTCDQAQPASLSPAATMTCSATYTATAADGLSGVISNTATVSIGNTPSNTATLNTPVFTVSPDVLKTADVTGPVAAGDPVTYTVTITNNTGVEFTSITVDDPLPGCDIVCGAVDSGERLHRIERPGQPKL